MRRCGSSDWVRPHFNCVYERQVVLIICLDPYLSMLFVNLSFSLFGILYRFG